MRREPPPLENHDMGISCQILMRVVNTDMRFLPAAPTRSSLRVFFGSAYKASTAATPATPANAWAARVTMGIAPAAEEAEEAPEEAAEAPDPAAEDADPATDDAALAADEATLDAEAFADDAALLADSLLEEPAAPAAPVMELKMMVLPIVVLLPSLSVETMGSVVMAETKWDVAEPPAPTAVPLLCRAEVAAPPDVWLLAEEALAAAALQYEAP